LRGFLSAFYFLVGMILMSMNFEGAAQYALERLTRELSPQLFYHSLRHTREDVLPAAERLAELEGVRGAELVLARIAALYHDIGFTIQARDHEALGIRIVGEVLPRFGFNETEIALVQGMIQATKLPQTPQTLLEQIIADADLDVLGRDDFLLRNNHLRQELAALGTPTTDEQWYSGQLKFLQSHRYFTAAARQLRDAQKQHNREALRGLLAQVR
jgi:uncharacterized protein